MKKKILGRCLFGAPMGVTLFVVFNLWASWIRGDGEIHVGYYLIRVYGTELNAMIAACISGMLIGMIWSTASLIYQTDWSLLKQTVVHYLVCTVPSMVIAYAMYWMPRNWEGLLQYLGLFGVIYVLNWIGQYLGMRKRVRQMNTLLKELKEE